jgi:predicted dehydrogenase
MGLVGPGFVARHHIDAVRRLGFVDIVAIADVDEGLARAKAQSLGVPKAYGSFEALAADPAVDVVHNTTPNFLHAPVIRAALARGKHVISEKPLAASGKEALALWQSARDAGVVHAVTFNYRGNPMVEQARAMVAAGEIGAPHFVHGAYLQDWLLKPTDFSWRLEPDKGGASSAVADIGSHWCDVVQHVTGRRIEAVLADLTTVVPIRYKPREAREAFVAADERGEAVEIKGEDLATILLRFDGRTKGAVSVGQVCAGHKNDFWFEVCGASGSLSWQQEHQNELWIGRRDEPNRVMTKEPALLLPSARRYSRLPGGHQQGWSDALFNVLDDVYSDIVSGTAARSGSMPLYPTFEDGSRVACLIDAVLESHRRRGVWTAVESAQLAGNVR